MTLVIEWDDTAEVTATRDLAAPRVSPPRHTLATALGAVAALALATWGLRRLRTA